jgi:prepilin-type N-terminal cleavage/methylation domain-containing protein
LNQKQGFTTIELMIVIAVLVVLATIALPNFSGWSTNQRLKGASRDLVSHLQWARSEAVKRQTIVALTFIPGALPSRTTGQGGFYILFVDDGGPSGTGNPRNLQIDGSEVELKRVFMPPGVALTSATFTQLTGTPSDAVGYNARGFPLGKNGGTVRLSNNKRYYDVQVASASGGISLSGPFRVD